VTKTTETNVDRVREVVGGRWRLGRPRNGDPLTVVPVLGGTPGPHYQLAQEAFADGTLMIEELAGGQVPRLLARNRGTDPVLFIDGEHLIGAKQNRIINTSMLLPATSDTKLPVTCVEQGRWHYGGSSAFTPSDDTAFTHLRAVNKAAVAAALRAGQGHRSDQGIAWETVSTHLSRILGDVGPTAAMAGGFVGRRADVQGIVASIGAPQPDQCGVLACVGGRVVALDAFDKPATLARLWPRLIAGYALEAIDVLATGIAPTTLEPDAAERFLRSVIGGQATEHDGVAMGMDVVITGDQTTASALVWQGAVVHMAAFADPDVSRDRAPDPMRGIPIARPARRPGLRRLFGGS
jgi:ARG/rhodanese/phosphatase superfamily protein